MHPSQRQGWTYRAAVVLAVLAIVAAGSASTVPAAATAGGRTVTWVQLSPAVSPPDRAFASMVFDPVSGKTVLFGGYRYNGGLLADTWVFDGVIWSNPSSLVSPPARSNASMVFDPVLGKTVLFGGYNGGPLADTWVFDGVSWAQLSPAVSPPARSNASMAFDSVLGKTVLFGGVAGGPYFGALADTWLFDGVTWELSPAVSSLARSGASMVFDPVLGKTVLFGGSFSLAETWVFDGVTWSILSPTVSPPGRYGASMVFDPVLGKTVLFGGATGPDFTVLADTWVFDGVTWSELSPAASPPARGAGSMVFDPVLGKTVLFGGEGAGIVSLADTWVLDVAVGELRVTTSPPVGSLISVDGLPRDVWGLTWLDVAAGSHEVCFSDVVGWVTPGCQDVVVPEGATGSVVGGFERLASLQVTTSPAVPATISVRDVTAGSPAVPRDDWGVFSWVVPGHSIEVCFSAVAGYEPPPCQVVPGAEIVGGGLVEVSGTYTVNGSAPGPVGHGFLRVTTSPAVPSSITVDGLLRDDWGLDWLKLAPGAHEVCFSDVLGYETPACQTVQVTAGQTATVQGAFTHLGWLKVQTNPPRESTISVDGVARNDWGAWFPISPGSHDVCFSADGEVPLCKPVSVTAGLTTEVDDSGG